MVEKVKIKIVVDDKVQDGLLKEHGFSVWIDAGGQRILFDTGHGPALKNNAHTLGVPLDKTDFLILSHGHYDHTGGIHHVLEQSPSVDIYCHPEIRTPRYVLRNGESKPIGMPHVSRLATWSISPTRLHFTKEPLELFPGIGITGPIPRLTDYENTGGPFYLDDDGKRPDPIDDDLALWIHTRKGVVVVVGCSHAGLINTLNYIIRLHNTTRIRAVIGGFHLYEATSSRMDHTLEALKAIDPDLIVPCHCTGENAMKQIEQALGDRVSIGHAGAEYSFGSAEE